LGSAPPSSSPQPASRSLQSGQQRLSSQQSPPAPDTGRDSASLVLSAGRARVNQAPPSSQPVLTSAATAKEIALASDEQGSRAAAPRQATSRQLATAGEAQLPSRQLDAEEIAVLIKSGTQLLADRDFAAARLMYQRAAEAGSAMAAFALAETYDPLVVGKLNVRGETTPDFAKATIWYEKAKELGSSEAPQRLERLARLPEE